MKNNIKQACLIILYFLFLYQVEAQDTAPPHFQQDTSKKIIIPLSLPQDDYFYRYCGQKLTSAICDLNTLYKDFGLLFSLTNNQNTNIYFPVTNLFSYQIEKNDCLLEYDIKQVESILNQAKIEILPKEINPPSNLQMKVILPRDNDVVHYSGVDFLWEKTSEADQYLLEISSDASFNKPWISSVFFGTRCRIYDLPKKQVVYWRIKPLNFIHYCEEDRASGKMFVSEIHVKPFSLRNVSVYSVPPPIENNVFVYNPENRFYSIQIESLEGNIVAQASTNANQKMIDVSSFEPGAYFVKVQVDNYQNSSTLLVR